MPDDGLHECLAVAADACMGPRTQTFRLPNAGMASSQYKADQALSPVAVCLPATCTATFLQRCAPRLPDT